VLSKVKHWQLRDRPEILPHPISILDEDADEELLALLARDHGQYVHYGPPYYIDPETWWSREQRRNPMPIRLWAEWHQQEMEAYRRRMAEQREQQRAAEAERRRKAEVAWVAHVEEINRRSAELAQQAEALWKQQRAEWTGLLIHTIVQLEQMPAASRYQPIIARLRESIHSIETAPPGPLQWRLDRNIFQHQLREAMQEIDNRR
jgi:hypothetical protein